MALSNLVHRFEFLNFQRFALFNFFFLLDSNKGKFGPLFDFYALRGQQLFVEVLFVLVDFSEKLDDFFFFKILSVFLAIVFVRGHYI